jgi:anion-transporting  ArsA/GET3 family ATPase
VLLPALAEARGGRLALPAGAARLLGRRALIDAVVGRDLVVVTGKGGVGKTTVAAALAVAAARRGLRVVVAEVASRDELSRALAGTASVPFEERAIADGVFHVSIDPQLAMEEYLVDQLPSRALAEALTRSRVFGYLAAATPGMRELLTIGKAFELAQDRRRTPGAAPYDLVVLDAPATGHGVAVLSAPRTFSDAARVGPVARQGRTIHEMLADPSRTGVVAVATAEEMPVNETLALRHELRAAMGLELSGVIVNGLWPDRLTAPEAAAVAASPLPPAVARQTLAHHRRARTQRAQLRRLRRGLAGEVELTTLPFVFAPALGPDAIGELAGHLR